MNFRINPLAPLFAAVVAFFATLTGCGDKGSEPVNTTMVKPKAGTTYLYNETRYDSNGVVTSIRVDTISVISANATLAGEMNLVTMVNSARPEYTGYARYESNNDLTLLNPLDTNGDGTPDRIKAVIYPSGSRRKLEVDNDTIGTPGISSYSVVTDSAYYAGEQSVTVPAGTFMTSKVVDVTDSRSYDVNNQLRSRVREISTVYIAPSIGFFARRTWEHEFINSDGTLRERQLRSLFELKSYTLK